MCSPHVREISPQHCERAQRGDRRAWGRDNACNRLKKECGEHHGERPERIEVLARIDNTAAGEIEYPPCRRCVGRPLSAMKGLRGRKVDAAPAQRPRAFRETETLVVDEEPLVEAAERLKYTAANEKER